MKSKILIAALAGLAVGAAVGILFAPEKGSKLRKHISKKGTVLKDDLMGKVEDGLSSLQSIKNNLLSSAEDVTDEVKGKTAKIKTA